MSNLILEIGTDVDEPMAKLLKRFCQFLPVYDPKLFNGISPEQFKQYNLASVMRWPPNRDAEYHAAFTDSPMYRDIEPTEGSVQAITHLSKKYMMHAVTNRRLKVANMTRSWISQHYPSVYENRVHILGGNNEKLGSKAPYCKELGLSLVVEDQTGQAVDMAALGIHVVLLNMPWNEDFKETKETAIRKADNWTQAVELIESHAGGGW